LNSSEIDFARRVFTDLVLAWTSIHAKVPDEYDTEGLAGKAIEIAKKFSAALDQPMRTATSATGVSESAPEALLTNPSTFAELARSWGARIVSQSIGHNSRDLVARLERYVIPHLGDKPAEDIAPQEILSVLRSIEAKGFLALAYQIFRDLRGMYRYAIVAGLACRDPTEVLSSYVRRPPPKNNAALTDANAIGHLLVAIRNYEGKTQSTTRYMLWLAPILFLRPVEVRTLEWADVDLDAATIVIPAAKMKARKPHVVPLPRQAVTILRRTEEITGRGRYVFTGGRGKDQPPTDSAFFQMLRRIGYNKTVTPHGFRAMAATWLSEQGWRSEAIERQLSHVGDGNWGRQRIYNRGEYMKERRKMLQAWADHLESLERRARTIPRTQLDFSTI
jgi:integrase